MIKPRILIVEDNVDLAKAMAALLRHSGFNAGYALNFAASLESMRSHPPAMVILDLNIGSQSGLDLLAEMRSSDDLAHLRVIIFTALDEPALRSRARKLGAVDFVVKGVLDGEILERLVRKHLDQAECPSPGTVGEVKTLRQ